MWDVVKKNPISTFAVLCVAATGIFLAYMAIWQTTILSSPDWCAKALQAEKDAPGRTFQQAMEALQSCNNLLLVQLNAIALDSHIDHGAVAFVLIVLIVVVIAGARASWKLGLQGMEGSVGREDAAAQHVVEGAKEAAAEVKAGAVEQPVNVGLPPNPNYKGPAMPPPPTQGS